MSLFVLFVLFVVNSKPRPSTDGGPKVSHLLGDAQRLKVTAMKTPRSSVGHAPYLIDQGAIQRFKLTTENTESTEE